MVIAATLVKELRELTGAGMMECKKALELTNGNIPEAIAEMRKAGAIKAAKKEGRIAAEGIVYAHATLDNQRAVLIEVNSETDFVARGDDFSRFVKAVASVALTQQMVDVAKLSECAITADSNETIEHARQQLVSKLGEKISIRRVRLFNTQGILGIYLHGTRIGVVVDITGDNLELAKDLAMHIAASQPLAIGDSDIPSDVLDKEREIYRAQAETSGKPADIIDKMVEGRIKKYLQEVSLLGQPFVKDPNMIVGDLMKKAGATVNQFSRFEVGEGIDKKQDDFVAEVMAQARGE
jgi:elongation factor Ts